MLVEFIASSSVGLTTGFMQEQLVALRLVELLSAVRSVSSLADLHVPCRTLLLSGEWLKRAQAVGMKPDGVSDMQPAGAQPPLLLSPAMRTKRRAANTNGTAHHNHDAASFGNDSEQPLTDNGLEVSDAAYALDIGMI